MSIAQSSIVSESASIGRSVTIGPGAIIYDGAKIGDNVKIEAQAIIYENVEIGNDSYVGAQCIIGERLYAYLKDPANYNNPVTKIGARSTIRSGTILYANTSYGEGFQTGHRAVIRENSHFGVNCSFGTNSQSDGEIKIGDNCRFHNNVFIATFTTCEDNVHFYPMSCTVDSMHPPCQKGREGPYLESGVIVGAKVLILPRVRVAKNCVIAGASVVTHNTKPGMVLVGAPAKEIKKRDEIRCHLEDRPAYEVALES